MGRSRLREGRCGRGNGLPWREQGRPRTTKASTTAERKGKRRDPQHRSSPHAGPYRHVRAASERHRQPTNYRTVTRGADTCAWCPGAQVASPALVAAAARLAGVQAVFRDGVAPAGETDFVGRRIRRVPMPGIEAELGVLLAQAALLRDAKRFPQPPSPRLPRLPQPPHRHGSSALAKAVAVGAIVGAVVLVSESINIAEFVFGAPPRPTLTGHKLGSPWQLVPSTIVQVPSR